MDNETLKEFIYNRAHQTHKYRSTGAVAVAFWSVPVWDALTQLKLFSITGQSQLFYYHTAFVVNDVAVANVFSK